MKVIENNIIPFKGYKCMNLFGILFVRKGCKMSDVDYNYEAIHTKQIREMLYVFFYVWYLVEYLVRVFIYFDAHKAYRNISFEREAYEYEWYRGYLEERKHFAWVKFLRKR